MAREPEPVSRAGTQPVHDADIDSLANERTMLAWVRTGFALVATGGLVLHLSDYRLLTRELVIGIATIALGVAIWTIGYVRFRAGEHAIATQDFASPVRTVRAVAAAVTLASVGALLIALLAR